MEDVDFMVNIVTFIFYYDKSYTTLLSRCPSILLCRPRRRALWLGCLRSRSRTWACSSLEHSQPGDELKGRHMMLAKDAVITVEAAVGASAMQSVETELRRTAHRRDLFRSVPEMRVRLLPCRPHGHACRRRTVSRRCGPAKPCRRTWPVRTGCLRGLGRLRLPQPLRSPSSAAPVATTGKVTGCPWKDAPNRPGTDQSQGQASRKGRKEWCIFNLSPTVFSPCRLTLSRDESSSGAFQGSSPL